MKSVYIPLKKRAVIEISGADARNFLQGVITNDIHKLGSRNTVYACLLTPQGKYLADFFLSELDKKILLDCNKDLTESLIKRLNMYKLRSQVIIDDISGEYEVVSAPIGAEVDAIPEGYETEEIDGVVYYTLDDVKYMEKGTESDPVYVVVK